MHLLLPLDELVLRQGFKEGVFAAWTFTTLSIARA
jgi:hypothetical protein